MYKLKQHKLFVTGLPRYGTARRWKHRIASAFDQSSFKVGKIKLGVNGFGHLKGFFYVNVLAKDEKSILSAEIFVHNEETEKEYLLIICQSIPGKIDVLFPSLTREQRLSLKFDPTGIFSCSDEMSADLITRLSKAVCVVAMEQKEASKPPSVLDMFGCVGGNAISYARQFSHVTTVELDPARKEMLVHNVCTAIPTLSDRVQFVQGDGIVTGKSKYHSVAWLDPPWGGTGYTKQKMIVDFNIVSQSQQMSMREVIVAISPYTDLIIYRLPNNFDVDGFLAWCVDPESGLCGDLGGEANDRPLPFRMRMGHKCTLIILCLPSSRPGRMSVSKGAALSCENETSGTIDGMHKMSSSDEMACDASARLSFGLHNLDAIIRSIHAIDRELLKELKPKFYDWEQKRNIRLKNWKGVNA